MGETTKIAWTATRGSDGTLHEGATFNPIWGCTKISPGCQNCYAEALDARNLHGDDTIHWGRGRPRKTFGDKHWNEPFRWNRAAEKAGIRRKVFCGSMCDVFESEFPTEARDRLWQTILQTQHLDWLLLTKRPDNIAANLPSIWDPEKGWPNVWLGCTTENGVYLASRLGYLLSVPAAIHFVSMEPLLGPLSLPTTGDYGALRAAYGVPERHHTLDWVIVGGESGPNARPFHLEWAMHLVNQCKAHKMPLFVKQMGSNPFEYGVSTGAYGKKGEDPSLWPSQLQVREWPVNPRTPVLADILRV